MKRIPVEPLRSGPYCRPGRDPDPERSVVGPESFHGVGRLELGTDVGMHTAAWPSLMLATAPE